VVLTLTRSSVILVFCAPLGLLFWARLGGGLLSILLGVLCGKSCLDSGSLLRQYVEGKAATVFVRFLRAVNHGNIG